MGKQNTPLILGFVNNAARNTFNVSQKQVQNKNAQQKAMKQQPKSQQGWTVVNNKKANTKGTQSFQSWADVASRNTKSELQKQSSWANAVKQQSKTNKPQQQQRQKSLKQQPKQQQQPVQTWGWYPASKQEAELKKLNQRAGKTTNRPQNKQQQSKTKQQNKQQMMKQQQQKMKQQQKMRNGQMKMKQQQKMREAQAFKKAQEAKKNFNLLKNINNLYDAFNYTFPSENGRRAWISSNKVGGDKVLSVATLFAIRNAPSTRGKKAFVQRNGQIIFNNKCIRRAVEGRFTGHKKFRGTRVLTYIPEKWMTQENSYAKGANYEKYANINGPKRNERCYSFKGVY